MASDAEREPDGPYPGLRPFEDWEWSIFRGREATVSEVIARLGESSLVIVHGGSGCGKSSLVRAGVLPTLRRDHRLAGRRFGNGTMRPSEGPLRALAALFAERLRPDPPGGRFATWADALMFDTGIVDTIEEAVASVGLDAFCLIVDQFEEIFRWARERGRADVQLLADFLARVASGEANRRLYVLVTMRSDYLGDCAQFGGLSEIINRCQYYLANLDQHGLVPSIVEPARMYGGTVETELVTRLVLNASGARDPLPTLQHALMRMTALVRPVGGGEDAPWRLTLRELDDVSSGGTPLSIHAEELYSGLVTGRDPGYGESVDWIFRSLVDVDVGGRGIRRPCEVDTLVAVSGLPADEVERVMGTFAAPGANLLVVSDPGEGPGRRRVDISHEALLRNWSRMTGDATQGRRGWLELEFENGLVWRALAVIAGTPGALLDAATLRQRQPVYARIAERPERARRYLLNPEGRPDIADEPEWRSVAALFARSVDEWKKLLRIRTLIGWFVTIVLIAGVVAAVLLLIAHYSKSAIEARNAAQAQASAVVGQYQVKSVENRKLFSDVDALKSDNDALKALAIEQAATLDRSDRPDVIASGSDAGLLAADSGTGFMWIGGADRSYLRQGGVPVDPVKVRAGSGYTTSYNMILRDGPPDANRRNAAPRGVVAQGATVIALAPPQPVAGSATTQYWLQVRIAPASPAGSAVAPRATKVFPQFAEGDRAAMEALRGKLLAMGYRVQRVQVLEAARGTGEVRYCHGEDMGAAKALGAAAGPLAGRPALPARKLGIACDKTLPGTLELWLNNP